MRTSSLLATVLVTGIASHAAASPFTDKLDAHRVATTATVARFGKGEKNEVPALRVVVTDPQRYGSSRNLGIAALQYDHAMKTLKATADAPVPAELKAAAGHNPLRRITLARMIKETRAQAVEAMSELSQLRASAPRSYHSFWGQFDIWHGGLPRKAGESDKAYFDRAVDASAQQAAIWGLADRLERAFPER